MLKFTFMHTVSTFHCFCALNFRQSPSIIEISRTQVHTGTPRILCHTTTTIACVFVNKQTVKNAKLHVYTHGLVFSLVVSSHLPSKPLNHKDIQDSSLWLLPSSVSLSLSLSLCLSLLSARVLHLWLCPLCVRPLSETVPTHTRPHSDMTQPDVLQHHSCCFQQTTYVALPGVCGHTPPSGTLCSF